MGLDAGQAALDAARWLPAWRPRGARGTELVHDLQTGTVSLKLSWGQNTRPPWCVGTGHAPAPVCGAGAAQPGRATCMPFSMRKAVMPCAPPSACVLAYTTSVSATVPFVHHILVPLSTKAPPRASARQRMPTTSDPAPGSLIASAPTCSPAPRAAPRCSAPRARRRPQRAPRRPDRRPHPYAPTRTSNQTLRPGHPDAAGAERDCATCWGEGAAGRASAARSRPGLLGLRAMARPVGGCRAPVRSLGRYFAFCASLPLRTIWFTHRLLCAP